MEQAISAMGDIFSRLPGMAVAEDPKPLMFVVQLSKL
jgi:hypothetical protein